MKKFGKFIVLAALASAAVYIYGRLAFSDNEDDIRDNSEELKTIYGELPAIKKDIYEAYRTGSVVNIDKYSSFWKQAVYYLDDVSSISDDRIKEAVVMLRNIVADNLIRNKKSFTAYDLRYSKGFRDLMKQMSNIKSGVDSVTSEAIKTISQLFGINAKSEDSIYHKILFDKK